MTLVEINAQCYVLDQIKAVDLIVDQDVLYGVDVARDRAPSFAILQQGRPVAIRSVQEPEAHLEPCVCSQHGYN